MEPLADAQARQRQYDDVMFVLCFTMPIPGCVRYALLGLREIACTVVV